MLIKADDDRESVLDDVKQDSRVCCLRIDIDVATKDLSEAYINQVRDHLRDLYCTSVPTRRLWLYLKTQRVMVLRSAKTDQNTLDPDRFGDGPEDVRVRVKDIVRPEHLGLLMHFTVLLDIRHR